jgi:hypothetical protein
MEKQLLSTNAFGASQRFKETDPVADLRQTLGFYSAIQTRFSGIDLNPKSSL